MVRYVGEDKGLKDNVSVVLEFFSIQKFLSSSFSIILILDITGGTNNFDANYF